jgi:hypothetical protein
MAISTIDSTGLQSPLASQSLSSPTITGAVVSSMASSVITSGTAQNSTSGTSIDFTGIPSWVKRITVMFSGVSLSGTSEILIRLGVSGTPETTGYLTNYSRSTSSSIATSSFTTDGFNVTGGVGLAANTVHGQYIFSTLGSNIWVGSAVIFSYGTNYMVNSSGSKTLAGTLNMIRILSGNGTDTFDAGSINILYE